MPELVKMQLSLVLPCFRPEPGWSEKVLHYYHAINKNLPEIELFLVIVNDGTPEIVSEEEIRKLREGVSNFSYYSYKINRGKGYALRYGISKTVTSSVVFSDLDFPYTTESFCQVAHLLATYDVVIGIKNNTYYNSVPAWRRIISKWLQNMIAIFFPDIRTTDTQCGLKGLRGKAKDIFLSTRINNYLFDLEFIVRISRNSNITSVLKEIQLRDNVSFVPVSIATIFRELLNFLKIIFIYKRFCPKK